MTSLCVPLAFYLAVTLAVPLLDGAWRGPRFWEHTLLVLAGAIAMAFLMKLSRFVVRTGRR